MHALNEVMANPESARRERTRAAAIILTRAYDDLNGVALLCAEGLPVQAAALAAALWEKAHQANTVTHDEERLAAWMRTSQDFAADNPVYRNRAHKKAFAFVADYMEAPITWEATEAEYRELCNMKHAHPFVMRHFGVVEWTENSVNLLYGPTRGGATSVMCFQTAIASVKALLWGSLGFVLGNMDFLSEEAQKRLEQRISEAFDSLERIKEACPKPLDPDSPNEDAPSTDQAL